MATIDFVITCTKSAVGGLHIFTAIPLTGICPIRLPNFCSLVRDSPWQVLKGELSSSFKKSNECKVLKSKYHIAQKSAMAKLYGKGSKLSYRKIKQFKLLCEEVSLLEGQ